MWQHFKLEEFDCKCGCGRDWINHDFVKRLDILRENVGFPLVVSSGYRCPEHNNSVSTTGYNGPHTTGKAVDLVVSHARAWKLLREAYAMNFSGIGVKQHGGSRFIHLDDLDDGPAHPRPRVWSYP